MKKACLPVTVITIVAIVVCIGFVFVFLAFLIVPLKLNPVYRTGMDVVKNDPAVTELFGSPIKDSFFVIGTTKGFLDGSEVVNLQTSISGPQAHGTVYIFGTRNEDGTCHISSISIEIGRKEVLEYSDFEPEKGFQTVR